MKKTNGVKQRVCFLQADCKQSFIPAREEKSAKNTREMFVASLASRVLRVFRAWESILPALLSLVKSLKLIAV